MKAKFVYESLGFDLENDKMVDMDDENIIQVPRFLIHISEPIYRDNILSKGLIPQDANKSKWGKLAKEAQKDVLFKNSIFATPFKNSIDVYDIKNINKRIFALPMVEEYLSPEDLEKLDDLMLKMKEEYSKEINQIKKEHSIKDHNKYLWLHNKQFSEHYSDIISSFIVKNANIDIWIIDTKGLKNKWFEDIHSGQENSVVTHQPISSYHLDLID